MHSVTSDKSVLLMARAQKPMRADTRITKTVGSCENELMKA